MALARVLAGCGLLLVGFVAKAQHFEIGAGLVDEIEGKRTETVTAAWFIRDGRWPIELMAGHIAGRTDANRFQSPDVTFVAISLRRQWSHAFLGFGVAAIDNQSEVLSSVGQFVSTVGYRFNDRFSVALRHMSNGNLNGRNRGENLLTVNVQF